MDSISLGTLTMQIFLHQCSLLFVLFSISLAVTSCSNKTSESSDKHLSDGEFVTTFFLVTNAKEFPSLTNLEFCRNNIEAPCHKLLRRVIQAKERLQQIPHDKALLLVLQQLNQYCKPDALLSVDKEAKCSGPFTAIYYFNSLKDEERIIDSLTAMDDQLLMDMLRVRRSWFFNRSEKKLWEKFAEQKLQGVWKEIFLEDLHNQSPEIFGLKLLEYQTK
jgi:hypothetical protein